MRKVTTHSIRYRILKAHQSPTPGGDSQVTTHSIRYRILKVGERQGPGPVYLVTTHSIRYRILKAWLECGSSTSRRSYNPFDPIQDTESPN